ncbi:MAG: hypothetical protein OEY94_02095 [Alphaproteobacteria bacterium]|nr:hypothetical protein [Alphaproteobacteria bacterium]
MYKVGAWIKVNDRMQSNYEYKIIAKAGEEFDEGFTPYFTPKEMLEHGVFEGKYMNDCREEFPDNWFEKARISDIADPELNYFGIKSRQSLQVWKKKGWIIEPDPRGWFQWYCRYYQGRRFHEIDEIQIKRWRSFSRHAGQIKANCEPGNLSCRPRQRQALLQWSYNPFI